MKIDRTAWSIAYHFHKEAVTKLAQMEQEAFWSWFIDEMLETSRSHGNTPLIMALLLAVFEDVEAADKERGNDTITQKGA